MHELMRGQWYLLDGINPEPWTSPEVGTTRRAGKVVPTVYKGEQSRVYQAAIKEYFEEHPARMHTGPLDIQFFFWRQVASYQGGHAQRVDATNLQKSTEDALQGILFSNDRENVAVTSVVMEQGPDVLPAILIGVHTAIVPQWPADKMRSMRKLQTLDRHPSTARPADVDDLF